MLNSLATNCFVAHAQAPDPGGGISTYYGNPQDYWTFGDTNNWTSRLGYAPASFTNLNPSLLGDGTAVVVDSADPAWLQYNVTEASGTNNLKVDVGSVMFWFAPNWSSTNEGGTGPGGWGRLIEAGSLNSNGWWSLYLDPAGANIYFSGQTNGGSPVTYLSAPIDWTTNYWHLIALTYTATNSKLYLDGWIATNGPGVTDFPGLEVLNNGFFIGSDSAGNNQAHGMFDDIYTYDYPLNYTVIDGENLSGMMAFGFNRLNPAYIFSASSTPSATPTLNGITGAGYLLLVSNAAYCVTSSSVWSTNMVAVTVNTNVNFTFTIEGGFDGVPYDVFATPALNFNQWSWLGQGFHCQVLTPTNNLPVSSAFFILGTPQDTDGDGLTDAYEKLVSKTDPLIPDTNLDGISDLYKVLHGLPLTNVVAVPSLGSISIPTCAVP